MFLVGVICVGAPASESSRWTRASPTASTSRELRVRDDGLPRRGVRLGGLLRDRTVVAPAAKSVGYVGGIVGLLLVVNAGGRLLGDRADAAPGGAANTIVFAFFLFWVFVTSLFLTQRVSPVRRTPES